MTRKFSRAFCWAILCLGVFATACSFVFIRESSETPIMLAAWRVLLSAILLAPLYVNALKRYGDESPHVILRRSLLPGFVLSIHFITWVIGARISLGVNATIIVSLVPLALPIIVWILFDEKLLTKEWIATGLAFSGLLILAIDGLQLTQDRFHGDLICFISMTLFALYLALARRFKDLPSLWLYLVPVYAVAGISSLVLALLLGQASFDPNPYNLFMVFCLSAVSTVLGHSALNFSMQQLRAQTVGLMTLMQFVIAGYLAYVIYQERPGILFYPASILMLAGVILVVIHDHGQTD